MFDFQFLLVVHYSYMRALKTLKNIIKTCLYNCSRDFSSSLQTEMYGLRLCDISIIVIITIYLLLTISI